MKPAPFDYVAARSLDEALSHLAAAGGDAKLLAGGQSLIPVLNFRLAQPAKLIDVNAVPDLDFVRREADGSLRLGALVRHRRLERDPLIERHAPLLFETAPHIAHPQIRNRGTLGGSLAHADPAAELPAVMVALGARFRLRSPVGERWVAAQDFFTGLFATALAGDEMLVEVEIPAPPPRSGTAFLEAARRHGDYAMAGVAVTVELDEAGKCRAARLVYLSVGEGPVRGAGAAAALLGQDAGGGAIAEAARAARENDVDPLGDIHASADFKRHLVGVLTTRALGRAFERARGRA
jgi:carbon-monoxide dehydrogenase medium subunit